jgi:hypothetical protein
MMNINFQYQVEQEVSARLSPAARLHCQLAMQAAKGMAVTRQKGRHGRVVCHHLLRMLSSEKSPQSLERSRARGDGRDFQLTAPLVKLDSAKLDSAKIDSTNTNCNNLAAGRDRQVTVRNEEESSQSAAAGQAVQQYSLVF